MTPTLTPALSPPPSFDRARPTEPKSSALLTMLVSVGEELGLFKILGRNGAMTGPALASQAQVDEAYVCEWLLAMVTLGCLEFDSRTLAYSARLTDSV